MSLFENNSKSNNVDVSGLFNTIMNDVSINTHNHGIPLDRFEEILTELILTKQGYESQKNAVKEWIFKYEDLWKRISIDTDDELENLAKEELMKGNLQKAEEIYSELYQKNEEDIKFIEGLLEKKRESQIIRIINLVSIKELQFKFEETIPLLLHGLNYSSNQPYLYEKLGANYFELGNFTTAIEYFSKSSKLYKLNKNFANAIKINLLIVNSLRISGNLHEAENMINTTIEIGEHLYSDNSVDFAKLYDMSAILMHDLGKYLEAEKMHEKAKSIFDNISQKEDLNKNFQYAIFLNNYAQTFRYLGNFDRAIACLEPALKIKKSLLNENHPSIAITLDNIANIYWYTNKFDLSIDIHNEAIKIRESVLPPTHLNLGYSYDNIALSYRSKQEYSKALRYQLKALKIIENAVGKRHHELGLTYNNLGTTYFHLEDYSEALVHYNKALEIRIENLGQISPRVGNTYSCLAWVYNKLGNYKKALELMQTALNIFNQTLPPNNYELLEAQKGIEEIKQNLTEK